MAGFVNRIVGEGSARPDEFMPNPDNWRSHSELQKQALQDVLESVGWVQKVIVNKRTGNLIDGHLRVGLAITEGIDEIPVNYVDLSEEEEKLVLATFDPLGALAETDKVRLEGLLGSITFESEAVQNMFAQLLGAGFDKELPHQIKIPHYGQEFVLFSFGNYKANLRREIYESFAAAVKKLKGETGDAMLDDVFAHWLGLKASATLAATPVEEITT